MMGDKLVEARRFLENSDDVSKELRFSALRGSVREILEYLDEVEDRLSRLEEMWRVIIKAAGGTST